VAVLHATIAAAADRRLGRDDPPRGSLALLRDPVFGPFWVGKLLSSAGIWVHNVAAAILTYQLTRSALLVGAVSVAQFLPQLLFAPLSGAMADRGDPRRQLVLGRMITAAGSGGLTLALAVLGVDGLPGAWPIITSAAVTGIGFVIGGPAMHSLLPTLVRRSELATAVALNHLPPTIARSAGPMLGAFLLVTAGPTVAFGFTFATNLIYALVLLALPLHRQRRALSRREGSVRTGFRQLRTDPAVAFLLLAVLALGFGADPVVTLTPALADALGHDEALVGTLASGFGVGAAMVFPLLAMLRRRLGLTGLAGLGLAAVAAGMALAALAPRAWVAVAGMVLAGTGFAFALTGLTTQLYDRVPEELRGRIMAIWSMAFLGSRPIAAAVNGAIADLTSVGTALLTTAGLVVAVATVSITGLRRHAGPDPASIRRRPRRCRPRAGCAGRPRPGVHGRDRAARAAGRRRPAP
jgi:MFS family permease